MFVSSLRHTLATNQRQIMSALADLTAVVTKLQADFATLTTAVQGLITSNPSISETAGEAIVAQLDTIDAGMDALAATLPAVPASAPSTPASAQVGTAAAVALQKIPPVGGEPKA
jgi:hypothetical protein